PLKSLHNPPIKLAPLSFVVVLKPEIERSRQHVIRVEPEIDLSCITQGAQEQTRADEQCQRERDLCDNERIAPIQPAHARTFRVALILQGREDLGPRGLQRRDQTKDHARRDGEEERKNKRADVKGQIKSKGKRRWKRRLESHQ